MHTVAPMPASRIALVLLGFPAATTLLSLMLLDRASLAWTGLDFFTAFWGLITLWYLLQIFILGRVLAGAGWRWRDIGYGFDRRRTGWFVAGYLALGFALVLLVQLALAQAGSDPDKLRALSDLSNLTPKTLPQRIVFVFMGLAAGLCEELAYRGFAIRALQGRGIPGWVAVPLAALPFVFQHGIKSLDQFGWFFAWGLVFGALFLWRKSLVANIVIHWLVILSAVLAILQALR